MVVPGLPEVPFEHAWAFFTPAGVVASQGDVDQRYPLASVTKLLSTWACLSGVEKGVASLNDSVDIESGQGLTQVTLRQLLSHRSGLPLDERVQQVGADMRRIYSNAGIELATEHVATRLGVDTASLIEDEVLAPLRMNSSDVVDSPAHSGISTVNDMVAFGQELLNPALLSAPLFTEATTVEGVDLAGIVPGYGRHTPCQWGLGVEIKGEKTPHWTAPESSPATFGHFGVAGSFLWVDPVARVGAAFLGVEKFGAWHKEHWASFNSALIATFGS